MDHIAYFRASGMCHGPLQHIFQTLVNEIACIIHDNIPRDERQAFKKFIRAVRSQYKLRPKKVTHPCQYWISPDDYVISERIDNVELAKLYAAGEIEQIRNNRSSIDEVTQTLVVVEGMAQWLNRLIEQHLSPYLANNQLERRQDVLEHMCFGAFDGMSLGASVGEDVFEHIYLWHTLQLATFYAEEIAMENYVHTYPHLETLVRTLLTTCLTRMRRMKRTSYPDRAAPVILYAPYLFHEEKLDKKLTSAYVNLVQVLRSRWLPDAQTVRGLKLLIGNQTGVYKFVQASTIAPPSSFETDIEAFVSKHTSVKDLNDLYIIYLRWAAHIASVFGPRHMFLFGDVGR